MRDYASDIMDMIPGGSDKQKHKNLLERLALVDKYVKALNRLHRNLETVINATPTGTNRNLLTDMNIDVLSTLAENIKP